MERSKNLREQSGERESKKSSAAERSAERKVARSGRGAVSEDHRNENAERQNRRSVHSAPMLCTVSAVKIASYIIVLIVYSHKVQLDNTTNSVSVPPVTNNIYRSAVPAPKYLPERRSAAFRHHYSPVCQTDS